ncbi:MAG: hypothetical protein ACREIT_11470 [Tepidisphaeraceae bacterium]
MRKLIAGLSGMALGLALTASSALACHTLSDGEVTQINADQNKVVVAKGEATTTFTTATKTKVVINGKQGSLADLKAGDKVTVDYEAANDVLEIRATREG